MRFPQRRPARGDAPQTPAVSIRVAALRLLGRREYTTAELADKLEQRGYDAQAIADLTTALRSERALDDRRVADAHVRAASRIKRRGRLRIERELIARGVDRSVVHDAVAELAPDDDLAAIRQILVRKRVPARLDQAARRRLFQHLMRRGFSADAISKVLGSRDDEN
jgi:regulatory protein